MLVPALLIFVLLVLLFGVYGAVQVSLWFILIILIAVVVAGWLVRSRRY